MGPVLVIEGLDEGALGAVVATGTGGALAVALGIADGGRIAGAAS